MEEYTELHELIEAAVIGLSQALDNEDMESYTKKLDYYVNEIILAKDIDTQREVGIEVPDDHLILREEKNNAR